MLIGINAPIKGVIFYLYSFSLSAILIVSLIQPSLVSLIYLSFDHYPLPCTQSNPPTENVYKWTHGVGHSDSLGQAKAIDYFSIYRALHTIISSRLFLNIRGAASVGLAYSAPEPWLTNSLGSRISEFIMMSPLRKPKQQR